MRLVAILAALLVLPACGGGETSGTPAGTDYVALPGADTTDAAALLGAFADGSVPAAFARLGAQPYRVEVAMVALDADAAADTLGVFRRTLDVRPGAAPVVVSTDARGSLADTSGLDAARLLPRDPFPDVLPDDPPFLDRRTRGAYRVTVMPTNLGTQVVAEVADSTADRPLVRRVMARRRDQMRTLSVFRASASAIYDEQSTALVDIGPGGSPDPNAEIPYLVETRIETGTPLRRRRLVTTWTIRPLDARAAQPDTTNTREP